jgi:hypothetical protein
MYNMSRAILVPEPMIRKTSTATMIFLLAKKSSNAL